jgi:hypothetical protein
MGSILFWDEGHPGPGMPAAVPVETRPASWSLVTAERAPIVRLPAKTVRRLEVEAFPGARRCR